MRSKTGTQIRSSFITKNMKDFKLYLLDHDLFSTKKHDHIPLLAYILHFALSVLCVQALHKII